MHFTSSERKLWRRWINKTGNPVVDSDTRDHYETSWSQHAATRPTCSDVDRNTIDEHQGISSSGTDGSERNTPTIAPTFQPDRNRTVHEHHVSTDTSSRPAAHHPCTCRWFPRPWVVELLHCVECTGTEYSNGPYKSALCPRPIEGP